MKLGWLSIRHARSLVKHGWNLVYLKMLCQVIYSCCYLEKQLVLHVHLFCFSCLGGCGRSAGAKYTQIFTGLWSSIAKLGLQLSQRIFPYHGDETKSTMFKLRLFRTTEEIPS